MSTTGKCRSCGTEVVWCKTRSGKSMPLDAVDPSTGNVRIVDGVAHVGADGSGHYVAHFVSCPEAAKWRRR